MEIVGVREGWAGPSNAIGQWERGAGAPRCRAVAGSGGESGGRGDSWLGRGRGCGEEGTRRVGRGVGGQSWRRACQQNWWGNGVAYGMRRGKCRGGRPDLDGDVRSDALTGSIAGLFPERR